MHLLVNPWYVLLWRGRPFGAGGTDLPFQEDTAKRLIKVAADPKPANGMRAPGTPLRVHKVRRTDLRATGGPKIVLTFGTLTRRPDLLSGRSRPHRAAPASPPVHLDLVATDADTIHLEVVSPTHDPPPPSLPDQVLALLASGVVLTRAKLRDTLAVKNERLGQALESLERAGRLRRTQGGWQRLD